MKNTELRNEITKLILELRKFKYGKICLSRPISHERLYETSIHSSYLYDIRKFVESTKDLHSSTEVGFNGGLIWIYKRTPYTDAAYLEKLKTQKDNCTKPEWVKYFAIDWEGAGFYFDARPIQLTNSWSKSSLGICVKYVGQFESRENWQKSLVKVN